MGNIKVGSVLLGKYLAEKWRIASNNGELTEDDYLKIEADFEKISEDFNEWLNKNYPDVDLEKEFAGDVFKELSKLEDK